MSVIGDWSSCYYLIALLITNKVTSNKEILEENEVHGNPFPCGDV